MRTMMVKKLGLPDDESPNMIDEMAFLISKSGLAADERAKLAMQISSLCQVLVKVPQDVQPRKARSVRSGNTALLNEALEDIGRRCFQELKPKKRTANYIAREIKSEVNKFVTQRGGTPYKEDSIRKALGPYIKYWMTEQSPDE
jgi:hypothetical protein